MSENTDKYRRAVSGMTAVVDAVPRDAWSAPSPCEGWTAKDVVGHVIGGMQRISGSGPSGPPAASGLGPDDDPVDSYHQARERAFTALDTVDLSMMVPGPAGDMPLDQMVGVFATMDVIVHTWDLAHAVGLPVTLDQDLVQEAYDRLRPMDAMIRVPGVFGPKVDPPAGADLQTQLMCFLGRKP